MEILNQMQTNGYFDSLLIYSTKTSNMHICKSIFDYFGQIEKKFSLKVFLMLGLIL